MGIVYANDNAETIYFPTPTFEYNILYNMVRAKCVDTRYSRLEDPLNANNRFNSLSNIRIVADFSSILALAYLEEIIQLIENTLFLQTLL